MSNTNRKARKTAGVKFIRTPKVGTPVQDRAEFNTRVLGNQGTKHAGMPVPRSGKKLARAVAARTPEVQS